jgi:hypothetical protein
MWWFDLMWGNTYSHGAGWIGMLPIGENEKYCSSISGSDNRTQVDPDDCEIMQYTGIKDKNDKEIYEGDILLIDDGDLEQYKSVVRWNAGGLIADCPTGNDYDITLVGWLFDSRVETIEVIGNIYENPELLNLAR